MKILNLYAGIGGNRLPWDGHDITSIEIDTRIAYIYHKRFPDDDIIVGDSINYLEKHFHEFDFIWASPPCKSHSRMTNTHVGRRYKGWNMKCKIPDMALYGLITFLDKHFRGKWVVENVTPFYQPLIPPTAKVGRHLIWSSDHIKKFSKPDLDMRNVMYVHGKDYDAYLRNLAKERLVSWNLIKNIRPVNWSYKRDFIGTVLRNTMHPIHAQWIHDSLFGDKHGLDKFIYKKEVKK
jgi:DNA (cytosine-5)-methyltransferase 1